MSGWVGLQEVHVVMTLCLQNPTLYRVQEIQLDASTEGYVLVITPISKHSLRDVIYENMVSNINSQCYNYVII